MLARLDYGGISILIMGSCYPIIFYIFACQPIFYIRNIFLAIITLTSSGVFVVTMLPSMSQPKYRALRGFMFIALGLSAAFPYIFLPHLSTNLVQFLNP